MLPVGYDYMVIKSLLLLNDLKVMSSNNCMAFLRMGLLMVTTVDHACLICAETANCGLFRQPIGQGDKNKQTIKAALQSFFQLSIY